MVCDFDISTREVLVFKKDSVEFTDKAKFKESIRLTESVAVAKSVSTESRHHDYLSRYSEFEDAQSSRTPKRSISIPQQPKTPSTASVSLRSERKQDFDSIANFLKPKSS